MAAADVELQPPPLFTGEYTQDRALEDLPGVTYALRVFLGSYMLQSEEYCKKNDPKRYVRAPIASVHLFNSVTPRLQ